MANVNQFPPDQWEQSGSEESPVYNRLKADPKLIIKELTEKSEFVKNSLKLTKESLDNLTSKYQISFLHHRHLASLGTFYSAQLELPTYGRIHSQTFYSVSNDPNPPTDCFNIRPEKSQSSDMNKMFLSTQISLSDFQLYSTLNNILFDVFARLFIENELKLNTNRQFGSIQLVMNLLGGMRLETKVCHNIANANSSVSPPTAPTSAHRMAEGIHDVLTAIVELLNIVLSLIGGAHDLNKQLCSLVHFTLQSVPIINKLTVCTPEYVHFSLPAKYTQLLEIELAKMSNTSTTQQQNQQQNLQQNPASVENKPLEPTFDSSPIGMFCSLATKPQQQHLKQITELFVSNQTKWNTTAQWTSSNILWNIPQTGTIEFDIAYGVTQHGSEQLKQNAQSSKVLSKIASSCLMLIHGIDEIITGYVAFKERPATIPAGCAEIIEIGMESVPHAAHELSNLVKTFLVPHLKTTRKFADLQLKSHQHLLNKHWPHIVSHNSSHNKGGKTSKSGSGSGGHRSE